MSNPRKPRKDAEARKVREYANTGLSEAKAHAKLMRERRLQQRKAYKGRRFRYEDVTRRSD